ncbi:MAG: CDP-alcohol phosphatidyltransferase family protein [Myxococcota bacterium]
MNAFQRAADIYRVTRKTDDFLWARYPSRPFAALFLALTYRFRPTPNLITVGSLVVGMLACVMFATLPGYGGLWAAFAMSQLAFIVDCMDGMQSRYAKLRSPVGVSFDYLIDAIKQFFIFPAIAVRLWWEPGAGMAEPFGWFGLSTGPEGWLLFAAAAGPIVATPIVMTSFMRSPAYTGEQSQASRPPRGLLMRTIGFLLNYPSWIIIPVALNRMDLFLWISVPLYAAYAGFNLLLMWRKIVPMRHYDEIAKQNAE